MNEDEGAALDALKAYGNTPLMQTNATLGDELMMRVGIPHRGGSLARHALARGYPIMVSASAFWHQATQSFRIPEATALYDMDMALDSAGFTAMRLWKTKGRQAGMAGVFPWTYSQYVELACRVSPAWWSAPDLCCEPQVASDASQVDYRVRATATLLEGTLRVVYDWQEQLARDPLMSASTVANMVRPPVPVIQGWAADDYLRSLDLEMEVWQRWQPWLAPPVLIGVGSVCRRSLNHPTYGLFAILRALEGRLPAGARLHLFGVKGTSLEQLGEVPWIASVDSMAWDMSSRMKALKADQSNSMEHRSGEMSRWMQAADVRLAAGEVVRIQAVESQRPSHSVPSAGTMFRQGVANILGVSDQRARLVEAYLRLQYPSLAGLCPDEIRSEYGAGGICDAIAADMGRAERLANSYGLM